MRVLGLLLVGATVASVGQLTERPLGDALAHPAIGYYTRPTTDRVAELSRLVENGDVRLTFDEQTGYLRSVLDALRVPVESQMLVMSKTGVQGLHTGPENPRAIFFDDAVTVGYIRGAPLLEFAVHDPQQGVILYTIDQKPQPRAQFDRPKSCLRCHQVYSTLHVPGMVARSAFVAPDGLPLSQFGTYDADDRTPFRRRWGGWYVTGTHGSMRHMGNAIVAGRENPEAMISERTLNRTSLDGLFDARGYVSAHSDIAALMVFQHQVHMTNLITRIGWEARLAASERQLDLTKAPMRNVVDELVDYALFVDEEPLTAAIKGTSGFTEKFSAEGPADHRGRSFRQLDLERRLLRYPCSYMIYSAAFRALPIEVRQAVYGRMWEILSGRDASPKYARLAETDRRAVIEILRDTVPDLPSGFRAESGWTPLWNGRDLDGWTTWLRQPEPGSRVFAVARDVDGRSAIRISGEVFGELRTKGSFQNYHLKLQFKWGERKWPPRDKPETPRDSGLLYHVHAAPGAEGRTWARSIELQIQEHDVGDLYAVGSAIAVRAKPRAGTQPTLYDYDPAGEWTFFSQSQGASGRCIKQPDNENPTGAWNTVELIAFGEDAIHIVNGKVVMRLHGPLRIDGAVPVPVTSGPIILQSEGAEVFYRDIAIRPITAIPPEFAAK